MTPSDTILLQSILDRIGALDSKVDHISEKQAVIAERVDSHIAASNALSNNEGMSQTKSLTNTLLGLAGKYLVPVILAVFISASCQAPSRTIKSTASDSTKIDTIYFDRTRFNETIKKAIKQP